MRSRYPVSSPGAALAALGLVLSGCMDLDVTNVNEPDAERALSSPADVASLIQGSYHSWFRAVYGGGDGAEGSPGFFMSNQAFQHASSAANWAMETYGRIPRVALSTDVTWLYYGTISYAWQRCYQALGALAMGLRALEEPSVRARFTEDELARYRVYAKLVQGLAHGTVALLHSEGFVVDEETDLTVPQQPVPYDTLMAKALAYFDEAIRLAGTRNLTFPFEWMRADLDSQGLIRLAHSYKARFRAQVARTPQERGAVDWRAVIADVDAGIQATHTMDMDWNADWYNEFLDYSTWYNWSQLPYFVYGMADQSGAVAEWYALPFTSTGTSGTPIKSQRLPDGRAVLIVTPDLRFPQGSTVEQQRAREGRYFRIVGKNEEAGGLSSWYRPERGRWRWSWYKAGFRRGLDYGTGENMRQPEITLAEMRLLKAEALYRRGDRAGAAAIVNETRVAAGLSPTDVAGTNASCVPKLPNGACGDLWEALKWEKRMETVFTGPVGTGWFFDGRGWGDLWKDTPLQLPMPCTESEVLGLLPCRTFGGPGGEMASPGSTYNYPFER